MLLLIAKNAVIIPHGDNLRVTILFLMMLFSANCVASSDVIKLSPNEAKDIGLVIQKHSEGNFLVSIPSTIDKCVVISLETILLEDDAVILHSELLNTSHSHDFYSSYIIFDPFSAFDLFLGARFKCSENPTRYYDFGSFKTLL